jgi:Transglycosylase-like domain
MSIQPSLANLRPWLCVVGIAALTLLAGGTIGTGRADAANGGIGTGPGAKDGSASKRLAGRYDQIWFAFPRRERRWAHSTSECESGSNPRAIGGGGIYRGAFQFLRSTWRSSPKSPGGDPIAYSYRTQAVVAVLLKRREGAGHWPVCG